MTWICYALRKWKAVVRSQRIGHDQQRLESFKISAGLSLPPILFEAILVKNSGKSQRQTIRQFQEPSAYFPWRMLRPIWYELPWLYALVCR